MNQQMSEQKQGIFVECCAMLCLVSPTNTEGWVIAINYNYGCNLIGQTSCRVTYPQISVLLVVFARESVSFVLHSVVFGSSSFFAKHSACLVYSATRMNKLCIIWRINRSDDKWNCLLTMISINPFVLTRL